MQLLQGLYTDFIQNIIKFCCMLFFNKSEILKGSFDLLPC